MTIESRWDLTAPESLVLRDGPGADRAQAVKLGLLELVTRASLRLVDVPGRSWLGRPTVVKVLTRGSRPLPDDGALAPIAWAFRVAREKQFANGTTGRSVRDVASAFATRRRTNGSRYVTDIILPALAARGLYSKQVDQVLGIFPRTRWFLTSDGERLRAELLRLLAEGDRELAGASRQDPRAVAALLATAGAATLLMTSAYPELAELSRRLRQDTSGDGGTMAGSVVIGTDGSDEPSAPDPMTPEPSPTPAPDPSADPDAFDFGAAGFGDLDLSAFDGVDSAFDAIDSGVDAGGDGGGDGGNGGGD